MKKKLIIAVLAVAVMGLQGCDKAPDETVPQVTVQTVPETITEVATQAVTVPATIPTQVYVQPDTQVSEQVSMDFMTIARKELTDTLEEIYETDSESMIQTTAHLMNWGVGSPLNGYEDMIRETTKKWMDSKSSTDQAKFKQQFTDIYKVYQELLGSDDADKLKAANVTDAAYPWSDEPITAIETINEVVSK